MNYPYYVDDVDDDPPDPAVWYPFGEGQARGITAYALRRNEPLLIEYPFFQELIARGEVELLGVANPEFDVGGCSARRRRPSARYRRRPELYGRRSLHEVRPRSVGVRRPARANALVRARAIEETRERNAELAIINESAWPRQAAGLCRSYDLVGERCRSIFDAQRVRSRLLRQASDTGVTVGSWSSVRCRPRTQMPPRGGGNTCRHEPRTIRAGASEGPHTWRSGASYGQTGVIQARVVLGVTPRGLAGESAASSPSRTSTASTCVRRGRCPAAHDDHLEPERRPRERAAVRRDETAARRDGRPGRRARDHQ